MSAAPRARASAPLRAYVLHRWAWSESSLIVDLFTRDRGRLVVVANGARRPYSQLRPVLLPFQPLVVVLGRAPLDEASEVFTLRQAEWSGGSTMPPGPGLFPGFVLNELLMRLLPRQDPHPALFDIYAATLPGLGGPVAESGGAEAHGVLRAFELSLLAALGVLPDLGLDTATQRPLDDDRRYRLDPEAGVAVAPATCVPAQTLTAASLHAAGLALQAGDLHALQLACAREGAAWRHLLQTCLHYHLGGPLRTREVGRAVRALLAAPLPPRAGHGPEPLATPRMLSR